VPLRDGRFMRAFHAKGRLEPLLKRVPVAVVLDASTGLWGAATLALEAPVPARAQP
jgi:glucokinase